jgi:hypothetical protein
MLSSSTCCFFLLSLLSLSANGETIRGAQRELDSGPSVVELLTAGDYVILTKAGISTVPTSAITGDIGVSPAAATYMTGFSLSADAAGTFSTSTQFTGRAYGASYLGVTPSLLTSAVSAMEAAYTDATSRANTNGVNLNSGVLEDLDNATLLPGVYTFNTGDVTIGSDITFSGNSADIFIIQMTGNLKQVANKRVHLSGGALAKNIFWQVAGFVEVEAGAHMEGILLVKTHVLFKTGSSLNGRILAQTACDLQMATITQPAV